MVKCGDCSRFSNAFFSSYGKLSMFDGLTTLSVTGAWSWALVANVIDCGNRPNVFSCCTANPFRQNVLMTIGFGERRRTIELRYATRIFVRVFVVICTSLHNWIKTNAFDLRSHEVMRSVPAKMLSMSNYLVKFIAIFEKSNIPNRALRCLKLIARKLFVWQCLVAEFLFLRLRSTFDVVAVGKWHLVRRHWHNRQWMRLFPSQCRFDSIVVTASPPIENNF